MELQYRKCATADFNEIFQLLTQLWPTRELSREQLKEVYERSLLSSGQVFLCAVHDSVVVGFCSLSLKNNLWAQGNHANIDELVVDEQYRGQKIGSELLNRIIKIAEEHDCKYIELASAFHREKAHEFYMSHGFEKEACLFSRKI